MIILLVISIFRLEAYFKKSMHFNINYIVTVPPYCTCYIDEWHNVAMITKSVTQRRPIVFPVKITMCNHKINHHHSCLNHHCKMYETSLHTVQSDQGPNQKQHRRSCQQNGIQYPGSVAKRPISCSTWPSMKFIMLTYTWIPTIIGILILICLTSTTLKPINKKRFIF